MKWEQLPVEIQEKMLEEQVRQGNKKNIKAFTYISADNSGGGFNWGNSVDGYNFWGDIISNGNINRFYEVYPKNQNKQTMNTLTRKQLIEAYNRFECGEWQSEIREILTWNVIATDDALIEIPERTIQLLIERGTPEQKEYGKKLGIKLNKDKNAFTHEMKGDELAEISRKLFGDRFILQPLLVPPHGMQEFYGKAFYIHPVYKVNIGETATGGTYITIEKK